MKLITIFSNEIIHDLTIILLKHNHINAILKKQYHINILMITKYPIENSSGSSRLYYEVVSEMRRRKQSANSNNVRHCYFLKGFH